MRRNNLTFPVKIIVFKIGLGYPTLEEAMALREINQNGMRFMANNLTGEKRFPRSINEDVYKIYSYLSKNS